MLFNSYGFIFAFLPLALAGFFIAGRWGRAAATAWLLLASVFFYGWWNPRFVGLLAASIVFNFAVARCILAAPPAGKRRRAWLWGGVGVDLAALAYFKYANFFLDNLAPGHAHLDVVLPLGISFFTFTQIAFLVDASRGQVDRVEPLRYGLFVTFFPHLIAGPLYHHSQVIPQLRAPGWLRPDAANLQAGLYYFVIGLFKKAVVADSLSPIADLVFNGAAQGQRFDGLSALLGVLAFTFQLYFDFSGYSDMAIGLARMLNVRLPLNFASPYRAASIIDFWRRWHITLSAFLRDYLYIPLGGNRHGKARRHVNLMATMLLGGLWHGAAWTFVAWGAAHGAFLVVNHAWHAVLGDRAPRGRWATLAGWAITFSAVALAWVLFRANSMRTAVALYRDLASAWTTTPVVDAWSLGLILAAAALAFLGKPSQEVVERYATGPRPAWGLAAVGCVLGVAAFAGLKALARSEPSPFLYFNF